MNSLASLLSSDRLRQWCVMGAIAGGIAINTLSNFFPLNGLNVGQLSNQLFGAVRIIPANYAFAIWGFIYLGLIALGLYQLQPRQPQNSALGRGGWLLVMASVAQIGWIYLFQARLFALSTLAMAGILLPLMALYRQLEIGKRTASRQTQWLVQYPISLYLAWISVATVVNVAIALYSLNWNGWGISPGVWATMMALASGAIAVAVAIRHRDPVFPLTIVWALVAIALRHADIPLLAATAAAEAAGLTGLVIAQRLRPQRLEK
ncbi:tryptophan-rich sensory protein [Altericista sp. CCNU0014]|uniref:tryptophan-rich sensory protein n=1 Tax=Altericista sp. CCNU0014 TaxID=3082949 RepID=UPI00384D36F6